MTRSAFELPPNNIQLNNALFLMQTGLSQKLRESTGGPSPQIISLFCFADSTCVEQRPCFLKKLICSWR